MNKFPIIKSSLFFIIGIIVQKLFPQKFEALLLFALSIIFITFLLYLLSRGKAKHLLNLMIIFLFIITGALVYSNYIGGLKPYPFEKLKYNNCLITGKVKSIELMKEGRIIFNADLDSVKIGLQRYKMDHEFIVRIYEENLPRLDKIYNGLEIGGKFSLTGSIQQARDKRNPGEFDYNSYLFNNNISGLISVYGADKILLLPNESKSFSDKIMNFFHSVRKDIDGEIQKYHSKKTSALLRGLLLGDYKKIDEESLENFVNAGVIHVLAVSGQHVALIILIFFILFKRFNVYLKYIFAIIGLIIFVFITGTQVSVIRAVIMGILFIAANLLSRDKNVYNILAFSALIILIFNPNELFSPGFQLSYSAVLSIVYLYPIFKEWIDSFQVKSKILKKIILFSTISLSAQIGTLPFTLAYFHKLSIAAILANLFIIPASGAIIYLGIITLFSGLLFSQAGVVFASANSALSDITTWLVSLFGKTDGSFLLINQFSIYDAFIYYLTLLVILFIVKYFKRLHARFIAGALTIAVMFLLMAIDNKTILKPGVLTIIGVDVGQGDATLIKFPNGKTALIDAGNSYKNFSTGDKIILPLMDRTGIERIDYTFITHLDADHYYGIYKLVEKGKIETLYKPYPDSTNKDDIEFEKYLLSHKCVIKYFSNQILPVGNCRLYFLNYPELTDGVKYSSNNKSMILKIAYGSKSFLFTGDAGVAIENRLADYAGGFIKTDLLKVGHHGGKTSSSDRFVEAANPEMAMISAGIENRFHHPAPEVLSKLEKIGAKVMRTDKNGAIIIYSDGNNISVMDWKKKESRFIFDL